MSMLQRSEERNQRHLLEDKTAWVRGILAIDQSDASIRAGLKSENQRRLLFAKRATMRSLLLLFMLALALASSTSASDNADQNSREARYGADVSIPIHHQWFRDDDPSLSNGGAMAHRKRFYRDYINNWKQSLIELGEDPSGADREERDRVRGNIEQPAVMVNYTSTGYLKTRAPQELRDMLTQFWEANQHLQKVEESNSILNTFETPTTVVGLDDKDMRAGGNRIKQAIWNATRPLVSEWTGQKLAGTSIYGIRVSRPVTEAGATDKGCYISYKCLTCYASPL